MAEDNKTDGWFNCSLELSATRTRLPTKIIELRRISQENHIKRIQQAYNKKKNNGLGSISSCISPSFPRKTVSSSKSYVTPKDFENSIDNLQPRRQKLELLPARTKSDVLYDRTKSLHSTKSIPGQKSTGKNIIQNKFSYNVNKSSIDFSRGDARDLHPVNRNRSGTKSNHYHPTKFENITKMPYYNNRDTKDKKCDEWLSERIPNTIKEKNNSEFENRGRNIAAKNSVSKIPILKSRLEKKDFSNVSLSHEVEKSNEITNENQTQEINIQKRMEGEDENTADDICTLPNLMFSYFDDQYKALYETFCKEEESRNEISFLDDCTNAVQDTDNINHSSVSSLSTKYKNITASPPNAEKVSLCNQMYEDSQEQVNVNKSSVISGKFDYVTDITDSEKSFDSYSESEDSEDDRSKQRKKNKMWKDLNFEADSTVTVPSDNDLEVSDHRDPTYRNLPHYPNTPYSLRYSRYKLRQHNNVFNSFPNASPKHLKCTKGAKNLKEVRSLRSKVAEKD